MSKNPERAKRYTSAGGERQGGKEIDANVDRISTSRERRGSQPPSDGGSFPIQQQAIDGKANSGDKNREDDEEVDQDYAANWNFFERLEPLPGGSLRLVGRDGPSPGMTHPPQNPAVQKELMLHFQKHGVEATRERRPIRPSLARSLTAASEDEAGSSPKRRPSLRSLDVAGSSCSSPKKAGLVEGGSTWRLPWAPDLPMPGADRRAERGAVRAGGNHGAETPTKHVPSSAELWAELKEVHSSDERAPPPVSFLEMSRWGRDLMTKSRYHGFDLTQRTTEDVSELAMFHNNLSRSATTGTLKKEAAKPQVVAKKPCAPGGGERDLGGGDAVWSPSRSGASFPERRSRSLGGKKQSFDESMESVRNHSPQKLLRKAQVALHASPNRLQFLSDVSRVSTTTGAAPHRDRTEWLYGSANA
mmetsp:Transcript_62572/g.179484  ORF Transcript_62572/g.179484 Transcript_62572/m.179484 type:complete len:417 (-) Transcript_62572:67-1317(-)